MEQKVRLANFQGGTVKDWTVQNQLCIACKLLLGKVGLRVSLRKQKVRPLPKSATGHSVEKYSKIPGIKVRLGFFFPGEKVRPRPKSETGQFFERYRKVPERSGPSATHCAPKSATRNVLQEQEGRLCT